MTPHIACSKYERFCDFKPIRSASPINRRWIDALILWRNVYPCANILMQRCTVRSRWCSSNLPRLLPLARRFNQSCWSRRQKNSTITSMSFSSWENPRRVRVRVLALLENPQRDRVLEPALWENPCREQCSIAGSRLETRQWTSLSLFHGSRNEDEDVHWWAMSLKPWIYMELSLTNENLKQKK